MTYQSNKTHFIIVTRIYIHVLAQITCDYHANYPIKGKAVPSHSNRHRAKMKEHLYPYSTLALDGVGGQHYTLDALLPRKRPSTQHTGGGVVLGGPVWWVRKILHHVGSNPWPSNLWQVTTQTMLYHSNKSTNYMQEFLKFITWHLRTAQHVSGVLMPIIGRSTTAVAASGFTVGAWW